MFEYFFKLTEKTLQSEKIAYTYFIKQYFRKYIFGFFFLQYTSIFDKSEYFSYDIMWSMRLK